MRRFFMGLAFALIAAGWVLIALDQIPYGILLFSIAMFIVFVIMISARD